MRDLERLAELGRVLGEAADGDSAWRLVMEHLRPVLDDRERRLEVAAALAGLAHGSGTPARGSADGGAGDSLTGCLARREGMSRIRAALRLARRSARPVSLLFVDLDRFKQVNDRFGHAVGDAVLATVGGVMAEVLRGGDVRCRYGGDEFVLLLPDTPARGAVHVAEKLRRALPRRATRGGWGAVFVTASCGVSTAAESELDADVLVARADAAMYRAKRAGRNAVRAWRDDALGQPAGARPEREEGPLYYAAR